MARAISPGRRERKSFRRAPSGALMGLLKINVKGVIMAKSKHFDEAVYICETSPRISTSFLQRKLRIGWNDAARLTDELIEAGIIERCEVYLLRLKEKV